MTPSVYATPLSDYAAKQVWEPFPADNRKIMGACPKGSHAGREPSARGAHPLPFNLNPFDEGQRLPSRSN